jgi:4-diphosphocytidyl-2-C-methyl-D-erythritol kinase
VTVRVPAKLNLALSVGPRRGDGYHDLTTVFQAVALYDEVTATPATRLSVRVRGEQAAEVPSGPGNLAHRAAMLLARHTGTPAGAVLDIVKGIPVAGGMAGGSADAAGALVALDALWGTGCERSELVALAARLGSDVPFALHGGTALGTGRGELLTEVLARGSYHWVLALASGGLATPEVYEAFDRLSGSGSGSGGGAGAGVGAGPEPVLAALRSGDAAALGAALHNDLQPAALALRPALRRVLAAGEELGALGGLVSGSGPTVALLAADRTGAAELAAQLAGYGVCRTVRVAHGPVAGARIVDLAR